MTWINTAPTGGPIGNRLQGVRKGAGAYWTWTGSGITPKRFLLFKAFDKKQLAATPAGIGDEGIVADTALEEATDPGALMAAPPSAFYAVYPGTSCGGSVLQ